MSARYFCDGCNEELTGANRTARDHSGRLSGSVAIPGERRMTVTVMTGMDGVSNAGDYCNVCIAAALRSVLAGEITVTAGSK